MKLMDALNDFLYDKSYFIALFDDNIHIYRYIELQKLSSEEIVLKMDKFNLIITGKKLYIKQMNKEELFINGHIINIGISYA